MELFEDASTLSSPTERNSKKSPAALVHLKLSEIGLKINQQNRERLHENRIERQCSFARTVNRTWQIRPSPYSHVNIERLWKIQLIPKFIS